MTFRNYKLIFATLLITYLSFNNVSHAVQFDNRDTKIDLPVLTTPNNAVTPTISADDNGHVYVVWSDNRGGPYKAYINTKFGESGWSPRSVPINTGFPKAEGAIQDGDATLPQVCSDNSGHVYVVWVDDRAVKAGTGKKDIYFRFSKDYGISWNAPDSFTDYRIDSDNPALGNSINPQIACNEDGNVYIVWQDDRNRAGFYEVYFRSLQVQFSKPTDFIVPYQTPELRLNTGVTAGLYSALFPVISTDKKGSVYVAWQDSRTVPEEDSYPGIYMNYSSNHGATWASKATRVDTAPVGFYQALYPAISSDTFGNVYVAWTDNAGRAELGEAYAADGTFDVYFNSSHNYGVTWDDKDTRIDTPSKGSNTNAKHVAIANNEQGIVTVVWADNRSSFEEAGVKINYNIFANHSENYGNSFRDSNANIRIDVGIEPGSNNPSTPRVQIDKSGNTFVTWIDNRFGTDDVLFSFSINKGRSGSWGNYIYLLDDAQPYGNSINPAMTIDSHGHVYIAWQDDRNTLVKDNNNIFFISGFLDIEKLLIAGQRLGESCFIATAAYGSPIERHVVLLREFRDKFLLTNRYGEWFVATYYRLSPPAAQFISGHPYLKPVVRVALFPFVGFAAVTLKTALLQKLLLTLSMTIAIVTVWWKLRTR